MRSLDPIICSTTYMINCDRPCTQTNFTSQNLKFSIKTGISVIIFPAIWVNFLGCNISKQMVSTLGTIVLLKLKNKNQLKTNTNGTGSMQTRVYLTTRQLDWIGFKCLHFLKPPCSKPQFFYFIKESKNCGINTIS